MPRLLIVEDSAVELALIRRLLARQPDYELAVAGDGADALESIRRRPPDLVLTDVRMPRLDGLGLLDAVRAEFPELPVVIVTAYGSEETALRALRRGAANYVPKRYLADQLCDVVDGVLAVSRSRRDGDALLGRVTRSDVTFSLPNDRSLVPGLVAHLQDAAVRVGAVPAAERTRVGVALEEALVNAMVHGNLEVGSELRERGDGSFERLVELRRVQPAYRDRRVRVRARLRPGRAEFVVRDEGPGFDVSRLPDPADPENLTKASGRGLLLMRAFMDGVRHNRRGNTVRLLKKGATTRPVAPVADSSVLGPRVSPHLSRGADRPSGDGCLRPHSPQAAARGGSCGPADPPGPGAPGDPHLTATAAPSAISSPG